ncbi:MAG: gamma-glutamyl-gamma-aminobutyrate hydrolase family protein [Proteobacteria bacterium]|nr:gamma-glutamyl-gamma-aminobutyrate hydrolase family protein [Pseudomonadota bacterium]
MKKNIPPLIGITLDSSIPNADGSHEGYSQYEWYAVREKYPTAISKAGGIPILLPHEKNLIDNYLSNLDGLVITGGRVDIDPHFYGEKTYHPSLTLNSKRTQFEFLLINKALEKNMPILGICGGHQLLNVVFGGTLFQDIPSEKGAFLPAHYSKCTPLHSYAHSVTIVQDTSLFQILGASPSSFEVNSAHHQGIKDLGKGLRASAFSSDNLIEAIESEEHSFVMGLQWHPEFLLDAFSSRIFSAFINAAYIHKGSSI